MKHGSYRQNPDGLPCESLGAVRARPSPRGGGDAGLGAASGAAPSSSPPHAALFVYRAFFAILAQSLGVVGCGIAAILDLADFVGEVGHGGEKDILRMNGRVMLMEGVFVYMNGFPKIVDRLPGFGMVRRWAPARP